VVDDPVNLQQAATDVERFFSRVGSVGLKLPHGWFGRPHDNRYELRSVAVDGDLLVIALGDGHELSMRSPRSVTATKDALRFEAFDEVRWTYVYYGPNELRHQTFSSGAVELVA
jgi:hypothetical protein